MRRLRGESPARIVESRLLSDQDPERCEVWDAGIDWSAGAPNNRESSRSTALDRRGALGMTPHSPPSTWMSLA